MFEQARRDARDVGPAVDRRGHRARARDRSEVVKPNLDVHGAPGQVVLAQARRHRVGQADGFSLQRRELVVVARVGLLVPDGLRLLVGLDRAVVVRPRQLMELVADRRSECSHQAGLGQRGEVADGTNAEALEPLTRRGADAREGLHRQRVEEGELLPRRHHDDAPPGTRASPVGARLGRLGGELGHELGGRHPHRRAQTEVVVDARPDARRDRERLAEEPPGAGHIEERFVQGDALDEGGERPEHLVDATAVVAVQVVTTGEEHRLRAQPPGPRRGHRRVHAARARLIGARGDDPPIPCPPHDHGHPRQRRVVQHLHRRVERVHVDVEHGAVATSNDLRVVVAHRSTAPRPSAGARICLVGPALPAWLRRSLKRARPRSTGGRLR